MSWALDSIEVENESLGGLETGLWEHPGHYTSQGRYVDTIGANISARVNTYTWKGISCEVVIFEDNGVVTLSDRDGGRVAVNVGTIKYTINIPLDIRESRDKLRVCLDVAVNGEEEETGGWTNASSFALDGGRFRLTNSQQARCGDTNTSKASSTRNGRALCYTFGPCDGPISYDPFVYYEGETGVEATDEGDGEEVADVMDDTVIYLIIGCVAVCMCLGCFMCGAFYCSSSADKQKEMADVIEVGALTTASGRDVLR